MPDRQIWRPPCGCIIEQEWPDSILREFRDFHNCTVIGAVPCETHKLNTAQEINDAVWNDHKRIAKVRESLLLSLKKTYTFDDQKQLEILEFFGHDISSPIYKAKHEPQIILDEKRILNIVIETFGDATKLADAQLAVQNLKSIDSSAVVEIKT